MKIEAYFNNQGKQPAGLASKRYQKSPKQVLDGKQKSQTAGFEKYSMPEVHRKALKNKGTAMDYKS